MQPNTFTCSSVTLDPLAARWAIIPLNERQTAARRLGPAADPVASYTRDLLGPKRLFLLQPATHDFDAESGNLEFHIDYLKVFSL
jgi:hypothetical protein